MTLNSELYFNSLPGRTAGIIHDLTAKSWQRVEIAKFRITENFSGKNCTEKTRVEYALNNGSETFKQAHGKDLGQDGQGN